MTGATIFSSINNINKEVIAKYLFWMLIVMKIANFINKNNKLKIVKFSPTCFFPEN